MKVDGQPFHSIFVADDGWSVKAIDQTKLPHSFSIVRLASLEDAVAAIRTMVVRGAPLIGATAAYGMALASREDPSEEGMMRAASLLTSARPTAVNLRWAVDRVHAELLSVPPAERVCRAYAVAAEICEQDIRYCEAIGSHGAALIEAARRDGRPVNILTHCNAGWLCAVDWGTALAPIYKAHEIGVPVHVWVDETRPRNQGASLTTWELGKHGISHTLIVDNAGGHLMQRGLVDMCIVGSDRTASNGDVCNKIGTYLKALAAYDNGIPFYVALPSSTIDWRLKNGADIPIEDRGQEEVLSIVGFSDVGLRSVAIAPEGTRASNPAFDVTPARLVTALITERGLCRANPDELEALFDDLVDRSPVAG